MGCAHGVAAGVGNQHLQRPDYRLFGAARDVAGPAELVRAARQAAAGGTGSEGRPVVAGRASSLKEIVRQETERVERELIMRALEETGGNVTQAARTLKISRKSLQTKMKEFGLRDEK